jgi:hypothetical protein
MNVPVVVQLGLRGRSTAAGTLDLTSGEVHSAASWSGSYHILEMGQHFQDYVIDDNMDPLPAGIRLAPSHPYEVLVGKTRSGGVTGNIGECVAALFARNRLGAELNDIAHVRPRHAFRVRKAPDYMMRLSAHMPGPFAPILPDKKWTWPDLWPVESKARTDVGNARSAQNQGLVQLGAYWSLLAHPDLQGYGIVTTFQYMDPREIRVQLYLPSDTSGLNHVLRTTAPEDISARLLQRFLHGR